MLSAAVVIGALKVNLCIKPLQWYILMPISSNLSKCNTYTQNTQYTILQIET